MLQLDTLKFSVQTDELDLASKKIEALGTSLSSLTGNLSKLEKVSASAAKTQAEANLINAKAEAIADKTVKANEQQVKSTEAVTEATRKRQSVEERQAAITRIMSEGFSRGQSSILATAEALGEATERTAEYLKTQRAMQGTSPFDKSLGAATVFANELRVMSVANDLYAKGLGFTGTQLQELGREHVRLTEQFKVQGKDLKGLDAEFNNIVTSAKQVTDAENSMALSMKQADKASSDAGKANNFLAREMQRVDAVLTGFNDNLNVTSSNRLMKFREQLRLSGTDAATAATMLKGYEEKLKTINSVSQSKAKNSREEELRYLARATSVQLGDIGISLAGGQNPLLVLIQQGDQLRGVLNQVSANGQEMQKALSMAFSQIVVGSKDVVMALGSFVVGAFADSGRAVARFGSDILGVSGAIERLKAAKFAEWAAEGEAGFSKISRAMKASELAVSALGAGIGVFVALAAASTVALYQVTSANDDLTRSLVATGAQLGFTTEYAQGLATVLTGMGATRVDVLNAFSEISKSGNIASESFLQVAEAALVIERVGGPAIKETVKLFGDLKEKSVETLTKYAEQTGLVTVAQIAYVAELVNAGREISATTEATNILTAAIKEQAEITYASLSSMGRLWVDLKTGINDAWGSLQDFTSSSGLLDGMTWAIGRVAANFLEVMYQLSRGPRLMAEGAATAIAIAKDVGNLDTDFTEFNKIRTAINDVDKERQDAHDKQKRRLLQEGEFSTENIKREAQAAADLRKKNSEAASANADNMKVDKIIKDEADRAAVKTLTRQQFINKAIEDKNKLLREGSNLSKEQLAIIEKTAGIEYDKSNKPKKQPKSDAMKGAEDDASWYRKSIERIDDLKNKTIGAVEQLSKAQVLLRDLGDDDSFKKLSAQQQMRLVDRINEIDLLEEQLALEKEQKRVATELTKIANDNAQFSLKEQANVEKILSSSQLKLSLLGKTADEQFAITEAYELQNKLNETGLRFDQQRLKLKQEFEKIKPTSGEDRRLAEAAYAASLAEINAQEANTRDALMQESANKFQAAYIEKILNIGKTLSDAITTALFEGGQAGTKKLKDYIVGIFREKINVQVNAVVNGLLNSVTGSVLGTGSGAGGGGSNLLNSASNLNTLYGAGSQFLYGGTAGASNASLLYANGTQAVGGDGLGALIQGNGGWQGVNAMSQDAWYASEAVPAGTGSSATGGAGFSMTAFLPLLFAAYGASRDAFRVSSTGDSNSQFDAQGRVINRSNQLFGGSQPISIASIVNGVAVANQARPSDYTTNDLALTDGHTQSQLDAQYAANSDAGDARFITVNKAANKYTETLNAAYLQAAKSLGLGAVSTNFTYGTNDTRGGGGARLGASAGSRQFDSGDISLSAADLQLAANRAILTALEGSDLPAYLQGVFDNVDAATLDQTGIDAAIKKVTDLQAAYKLLQQIPGADLTNISYDTLNSLKDVAADLVSVDTAFFNLGYTLLDVSTAGGQAAASLTAAFGGLQAFQSQMSNYAQNFLSTDEQQSTAYASVQGNLQNAGFNYTLDQLRAATRTDIRGVVDSLFSSGSTATDAQKAAAVAAANALAALKPTTDNSTSNSNSSSGGGGGGGGGSGDSAAKSIANAWKAITDSIWNEVKRIRGLLQESSGDALNIAKQEFEKATIAARGGDQEAAKALPELSKTLLTIAQSQSSTLIELRRAQALTANSLEQTVTGLASTYGLTVPAFASGGNYAGGMALVGEQGPELINFNQGGYIHNAGQTSSMLGGSDELISEIRRLNNKVEQLEAAAISTAVSNTKLLKLFERVTPDGNTIAISGTVTTI